MTNRDWREKSYRSGPLRQVAVGALLFMTLAVGAILGIAVYLTDGGQEHASPTTEPVIVPHESTLPFYDVVGDSPFADTDGGQVIDEKFTIELSVARQRARAEALIEDYEAKGVNAYFTPFTRDGTVLYRVRTGLFGKKEQANAALGQLATDFQLKGRVVKLQ